MMLAALSPLFFPLICFACGIYIQVSCVASMTLLLVGVCSALGLVLFYVAYSDQPLVLILRQGSELKALLEKKPALSQDEGSKDSSARMVRQAPSLRVKLRRGRHHERCNVIAGLFYSILSKLNRFSSFAIGFLFFFSGAVLVQAQREWQKEIMLAYADKEIDVVCVIDDITQRATYQDGHIIELRVCRARCCHESGYKDVSFKLMLYTNARPSVKVGDVVEFRQISFSGTEQPRMGNNPSFQNYLLKEGVVGSLFVYGAIDYGIIERPAWSLKGWLWRLREDVYCGVKRKLSPQTFQYFALIFLGNKQQEKSEDLRQTFSYWGLSHYLARAGLHIILFIMVWSWLLNLFPVHLRFKQFMLLVMCIVYALLSWYSIPFARALGSFLLAEGGRFFGYQPTFFHTLTLLCCVILMYSPMQLFFLDFQLTFGLTFVLSWYGRCISTNRQES